MEEKAFSVFFMNPMEKIPFYFFLKKKKIETHLINSFKFFFIYIL
jgi:hypothetical protein